MKNTTPYTRRWVRNRQKARSTLITDDLNLEIDTAWKRCPDKPARHRCGKRRHGAPKCGYGLCFRRRSVAWERTCVRRFLREVRREFSNGLFDCAYEIVEREDRRLARTWID